ncbi:MAG: hypothetical protein U5O16_19210 [Rhodococcus sp. (in: high G+C Gram-positive bacteria)]|uniref:hypothetical protein n=1 Tax=Rhodococcus TaxID=1827 RepID=UPI001E2FD2F6|nr:MULTISPECIES: hypothetical protein [Rhodococcus erythropolis group]MCD2104811.1 hypothetical protein [Rhodococcus qingshengii]MCZ4525061.1 hypothetical protein [Rhodococcus erythropolis]MDZ7913939.1 hypothetical protein [Rhodococcus sp. (in: high G+C Gram-positive bacteria)]
MSEEHERLVAEFRALAETVLTRLEPVLQKAAAASTAATDDPGSADTQPVFSGCSWCPVCALAALVRGEHHELLAFLAGQAAAFLALLREILDEFLGAPSGPDRGPDSGPTTPGAERTRTAAFVPINVTVKD